MPDQPQTRDAEWELVWDARLAALSKVLGQPDEMVLHGTVPFELGGTADVVQFRGYVPGITYVTAELTGAESGQRLSSLGEYELMICSRQEWPPAADIIAHLASYTCKEVLEPGETMDIHRSFSDTTICALLFAQPGERAVHIEFLGQRYGLLLCMGITASELAYKKAHGADALLALLREHGAFPYTTLGRTSVPLPQSSSIFGRLFGRRSGATGA